MSGPGRCTRRSALGGIGAVAFGGGLFGGDTPGTEVPPAADYGTVVDVVEAGADPTGEQSITPVLRANRGDDTLFRFPEGRYRMAEQFRFTDFENLGFVGDDATIVPADYHDFEGEARCFKLGTYYAPGRGLRFEGIDFDVSAPETGIRAVQAQVADDLVVRDVTVRGHHDSGTWGPMLFDVTDPGGEGVIDRVRLPDGGAYTEYTPGPVSTGPIGILVSRYHQGHLRIRDCVVDGFPDNGLYARNGARTTVEGGEYRNCNVASIRIGGDGSEIRGATVVVDRNRPDDRNQTGIRLDRGSDLRVRDVELRCPAPNGPAINVQNEVDSASIRGSTIAVGDANANGIVVQRDAGPTEISETDVRFDGGGNAILLRAGTDDGGSAPVLVDDVTITGDAHGRVGRHAIRCERADSTFRSVVVDQRGEGHRRCLELGGDDCLVFGGSYRSTHHPIVNHASGTRIVGLRRVESDDGRAAIRLLEGYSDVSLLGNVLYGGVRDDGTENLWTYGNRTPSH